MDLLESLEIYIPVEAEVKNIDIRSLPNSVVRRMGLSLADSEGPRKLAESPEGIWICPAVLRRKGQKTSSTAENNLMENISSLMGKVFQATPGPFRMSIVSSNRAAFKVLKDTTPGKKIPEDISQISMLPPTSALQTYRVAVVIYHGRIYLSIRKSSRKKSKQGVHEPQQASHSAIPSTSNMSSQSQKRQSPQASAEPADREIQKKRLRIILPQIATKQPKDVHTKTDQKLLNNNSSKKKLNSCKVTQSENRKGVLHKGRDVSSCKTARAVPQSTDSVHNVHSHCKDARGKQAAEEAADSEPAWFQPQGEQEQVAISDSEIQDLGSESANQNDMGRGKSDNSVGIVEQSSNQSRTRRESEGVAHAPASIQQECDFTELEQEEMIAQLKAKLRQEEVALGMRHNDS
uniref:uncharacterized protein si:dkeyp-110g5.4 n=1 Tax=Scatophagus argus TaxID=75038 RepID=UPI001ED846DA|nr:uncharacterized protein si:dkeyp-110g5.4 [Scatophagus argus]